MTTLKEETPFAAVLSTAFHNNTCSFCFTENEKVRKCNGCHVLSYCNTECQKGDWADHKHECGLLKKNAPKPVPRDHVRLTARILLKSEKALDKKAFNDHSWDSLEPLFPFDIKGKQAVEFYAYINEVVDFIKPLKNISRTVAAKTLSKVTMNKILIINDANIGVIGIGIYLGLSVHKHSCLPDAQITFTGTKASLRLLDEQKKSYSADLTVSYTYQPLWFPNRKGYYKTTYFQECRCELCTNETHIVNKMSSSCYVSCCEDGVGFFQKGVYKCNKCGTVSHITVNDVNRANTLIEGYAKNLKDRGAEAAGKAKDFVLKMEKILSIYNFQFINLCEDVMKLAGDVDAYAVCRLINDKLLKACKYYLHDSDWTMVKWLIARAHIKTFLGQSDDFDIDTAFKAAERCYGEDHPYVVDFKTFFSNPLIQFMGSTSALASLFNK